MDIAVIGVNHSCSSFTLREELTSAFEKAFVNNHSVSFSYVPLVTCNRAEIYYSSKEITKAHSEILKELRRHVKTSFEHCLYSYFDTDTFLHLARVSSGLDSALLGESEIQSQVKRAYETARKAKELPSSLHYLFQKSLRLGKFSRSGYLFAKEGSHLSSVMLRQIEAQLDSFEKLKVLFVGNSEINRRTISAFMYRSFHSLTLVTSHEVDRNFHKKYPGVSIKDHQELSSLENYDVIVLAGKYQSYLVDEVPESSNPKMMFDLCVPRSVHPKLKHHRSVTLFDMEKLSALFEKRQEIYKKELSECEQALSKYVGKYFTHYHKRKERKKFYVLTSIYELVS